MLPSVLSTCRKTTILRWCPLEGAKQKNRDEKRQNDKAKIASRRLRNKAELGQVAPFTPRGAVGPLLFGSFSFFRRGAVMLERSRLCGCHMEKADVMDAETAPAQGLFPSTEMI
jgi:hypothetical protein